MIPAPQLAPGQIPTDEQLAAELAEIEKELEAQSGRFTSNDLRKMVVQEADIEAKYLELQQLAARAHAGLRLAAGLPTDAAFSLSDDELPDVEPAENTLDGWLNVAAERRGDLVDVEGAVPVAGGQVALGVHPAVGARGEGEARRRPPGGGRR